MSRVALLGSPGLGIARRIGRGMITGTPAQYIGDNAATFAAVTAGHHLNVQVYVPGFGLVTEVIAFAGTENSRALFIAAINAASKKFKAKATPAALGLTLYTTQLGSMAEASILGATSADVLTNLGLAAAAFRPSFGVRMLPTRNSGKSAVQYFGGVKPFIGENAQPANQHAIVFRAGRVGAAIVVDRQKGRTVANDSVHFTPERIPG